MSSVIWIMYDYNGMCTWCLMFLILRFNNEACVYALRKPDAYSVHKCETIHLSFSSLHMADLFET